MTVHAVHPDNERLRRRATYASISIASLLIVAKLAAYLLTDSMTMLTSLLDSTVDLLSSMVTAFGVVTALRPPDHDHRFGHGKAEPLAALAQAAFIVGSSVLLGYEAISRLYNPHAINNENFGYAVMLLSIVLTVMLLEFQRYVIRHTNSMAISADRLHYVGDLVINGAVIATLVIHQIWGQDWCDPVFAVLIAIAMIASAFNIARQALNVLMDKELPDEDHEKIRLIVEGHPGITGLHGIRTRTDSERIFMELHIEMDGGMNLADAHKMGASVAKAVKAIYPNADILTHEDPTGLAASRKKSRELGDESPRFPDKGKAENSPDSIVIPNKNETSCP